MLIGNPMMLQQLPIEDALERMTALGYEGIEICLPNIQMVCEKLLMLDIGPCIF